MRPDTLRWTPSVFLGLLAAMCSASPAPVDGFVRHWENELVRLQSWPAQVERDPSMLIFCSERLRTCQMRCHVSTECVLPPVLYLLDRQDTVSFVPGMDHTWAALDVRDFFVRDEASANPNPERQSSHEAILAAVRALDVLAGLRPRTRFRCGVVGEGLGGTIALAVAALRPDQVAFVCAHEPTEFTTQPLRKNLERWRRETGEAAAYVAPEAFARLVTVPALVSLGEADQVARPERVEAIYEALNGPKELTVIGRGRHCQPPDLRQWAVLWRQWADER